jgi:prolyl oligopeptidase
MFLAHKKGLHFDSTTPALLYGYGGFNSITLPDFSPDQAMFIRNFNGVYAVANIRGGG